MNLEKRHRAANRLDVALDSYIGVVSVVHKCPLNISGVCCTDEASILGTWPVSKGVRCIDVRVLSRHICNRGGCPLEFVR